MGVNVKKMKSMIRSKKAGKIAEEGEFLVLFAKIM